jgi:AAA domain/Helix-turn-helix domain
VSRDPSLEDLAALMRDVPDAREDEKLAQLGKVENALASFVEEAPTASNNSFPPLGNRPGGNECFRPLLFDELVANAPPEPPWFVRGYVSPYALTLLAGRPKAGKSTALMALIARLLVGERFAGLETTQTGVLLLTEERRDTLAEKGRLLGLSNSFPPGVSPSGGNERKSLYVVQRSDASLPWPDLVASAAAHCLENALGVLVVDTWDRWTSLRGDSENSAGSVNEALEPLQAAAHAGLAVLIVSHQRKSSGEFGDAVRGSNALTGGVDIVVELERPGAALRLSKNARVLRAVSRFTATPEELYLELDEDSGGFTAIDSPEEARADAERSEVLQAVTEAPGSTSSALAERVDLPAATVRRHLKGLLDSDQVARSGEGKRNSPHTWHPPGGEAEQVLSLETEEGSA